MLKIYVHYVFFNSYYKHCYPENSVELTNILGIRLNSQCNITFKKSLCMKNNKKIESNYQHYCINAVIHAL